MTFAKDLVYRTCTVLRTCSVYPPKNWTRTKINANRMWIEITTPTTSYSMTLSCQRLKYASGYQTGVPGKNRYFCCLELVPISHEKAKTFLSVLQRFNSSWQPIDLPNHHVRKADVSSTAVLTVRPSSNTSEDQMYDWTSSNAINLGTQKIFCKMQTKRGKLRWDGSSS